MFRAFDQKTASLLADCYGKQIYERENADVVKSVSSAVYDLEETVTICNDSLDSSRPNGSQQRNPCLAGIDHTLYSTDGKLANLTMKMIPLDMLIARSLTSQKHARATTPPNKQRPYISSTKRLAPEYARIPPDQAWQTPTNDTTTQPLPLNPGPFAPNRPRIAVCRFSQPFPSDGDAHPSTLEPASAGKSRRCGLPPGPGSLVVLMPVTMHAAVQGPREHAW